MPRYRYDWSDTGSCCAQFNVGCFSQDNYETLKWTPTLAKTLTKQMLKERKEKGDRVKLLTHVTYERNVDQIDSMEAAGWDVVYPRFMGNHLTNLTLLVYNNNKKDPIDAVQSV